MGRFGSSLMASSPCRSGAELRPVAPVPYSRVDGLQSCAFQYIETSNPWGRQNISFHQHIVPSRRDSNSDQTSLLKVFGDIATFVKHVEPHTCQFPIAGMPYPG